MERPKAVEPLTIVQAAYSAYAQRNVDAVFALLSREIEIGQTPELPWGGVHHGLEGARRFFGLLAQHTDGGPVPEEFLAAGEQVAVIGRLCGTVRATGVAFDLRIVHVWTVRGGRITRFEALIDTPGMLAALTKK